MVLGEAFEDVRLSGEDDAGDAAVDEEAHHLRRWLRLHAPPLRAALRGRPVGERLELYPSPALPRLAAGLASLLDEGGVLTIDYGADAATLIRSARRVPPRPPRAGVAAASRSSASNVSEPSASASAAAAAVSTRAVSSGMRVRSRLPAPPGHGAALALRRPGWCDLTADVDFTELAAAGEARGLATLFFGPQTALERVPSETSHLAPRAEVEEAEGGGRRRGWRRQRRGCA